MDFMHHHSVLHWFSLKFPVKNEGSSAIGFKKSCIFQKMCFPVQFFSPAGSKKFSAIPDFFATISLNVSSHCHFPPFREKNSKDSKNRAGIISRPCHLVGKSFAEFAPDGANKSHPFFCAALLCKKRFSAGGVCDRRECMERPQSLCRKAPQGFSDRLMSPNQTVRGLFVFGMTGQRSA